MFVEIPWQKVRCYSPQLLPSVTKDISSRLFMQGNEKILSATETNIDNVIIYGLVYGEMFIHRYS